VLLFLLPCAAQDAPDKGQAPAGQSGQVQVNWLYGAYVPKEVPLLPLDAKGRFRLYVRQTFTTPGIYLKTAAIAAYDQIVDTPPEWGQGMKGYGCRAASLQGEFMIQNTLSTLGNAALQYEPRYDRCRCSGFWPRTEHALMRTFVTYNRTETEMRPQIALYGAGMAAGAISSTWKQGQKPVVEGYQYVYVQIGAGLVSNWVGEFAPEIGRMIPRRKHK
jgi:hypothetical protein